MRKLTLLALMALLSACGGHDSHEEAAVQTPPPVAVGGTDAPDAYTAQVAAIAATQPDDAEPFALDASPPTMPENTEPGPVTP